MQEVLSGKRQWVVLHGKCEALLGALPASSVDHVITDPPYSEHVHSKTRRMLRGSGGYIPQGATKGRGQLVHAPLGFGHVTPELQRICIEQFARVSKRWTLIFADAEGLDSWKKLVKKHMRHIRVGAWVKIAPMPQISGDRPGVGFENIEIAHGKGARCRWNGGGQAAVWTFPIATDRNGSGNRFHTTQKPTSLMLKLVELFTDPGDIVLDPFNGSASTGVACVRLGRRYIGFEQKRKYVRVSKKRLKAEAKGLSPVEMDAGQTSIFEVLDKAV